MEMGTFTLVPDRTTAIGWNAGIAGSEIGDAPDSNLLPASSMEAEVVKRSLTAATGAQSIPFTIPPDDAGGPGANNVRFVTDEESWKHAQSMDPEELATHVATKGWGDVLLKLVELKPYIEVLWERFDQLKCKETILGCRTKKEFCLRCLHRSIRAVQFMLYGRAPKRVGGPPKFRHGKPVRGGGTVAPQEDQASGAAANDGKSRPPDDGFGPDEDQDEELGEASLNAGEPQTPLADNDAVPDLAPGTLDEVSRRLSQMADADDIAETMSSFFNELARSLLAHHPHSPSSDITVAVQRKGGGRIKVDDWLVESGREQRKGGRLGRVAGMDGQGGPLVRWYSRGSWSKPIRLPKDCTARVLFDHQAAGRFPEPYGSWPSEGGESNEKSLQDSAPTESKQPASQRKREKAAAKPALAPEDKQGLDGGKQPTANKHRKLEHRPPKKELQAARPKQAAELAPRPASKLVYEAFPGGPKVLEGPVLGESGEIKGLKYYVCKGEEMQLYPTLGEATAACDRIAGCGSVRDAEVLASVEQG